MGAFIDLTDGIFGRLTAIGPHKRIGHTTYWLCKCSCENKTKKYVAVSSLTTGVTRSCGCLHREVLLKRNVKHNKASSSEYFTWQGMKDRCTNPLSMGYRNYGGRGIYIDPSWLNFETFYKDMGDRPPGKTIGRIDNNGPYSKENCRWETAKEQCNNKRTTVYLTYKGETQTVVGWSESLGINYRTLKSRLGRDKSISQVLTPYEKGMNTRKDATLVRFKGKLTPLTEAAHLLGLSPKLLQGRFCRGWRGKRLFSPLIKQGGHNNPKYKKKIRDKTKGSSGILSTYSQV